MEIVVLVGAEPTDQQHGVDYGALLALGFVLAQGQLDVQMTLIDAGVVEAVEEVEGQHT